MMLEAALCHEALRSLVFVGRNGDQHWALRGVVSRQLQRNLQTAAIGHRDVEEYRIGPKLSHRRLHLSAPRHESNVDAFAPKKDAEHHHGVAVIVGDEDPQWPG